MLIFAIDDEPKMLRLLHAAIAEAEPEAKIEDFSLGADALARITDGGVKPDVVFSDIQMPGLSGLELALRLKQNAPDTGIVFVTGYSDYALEAYRLHVRGYVMKPVDAQKVREELDALGLPPTPPEPEKLRIRCFGTFEVFWQGSPLVFSRQKTKELLAYLIKEQGAWCSTDEIVSDLWEDSKDDRSAKGYLRVLTNDLIATLRPIGMEDIIKKQRGQLAVDAERLDCDYYRMVEGDMEAINAFHGEYMTQYGWADILTGTLYFRNLIVG